MIIFYGAGAEWFVNHRSLKSTLLPLGAAEACGYDDQRLLAIWLNSLKKARATGVLLAGTAPAPYLPVFQRLLVRACLTLGAVLVNCGSRASLLDDYPEKLSLTPETFVSAVAAGLSASHQVPYAGMYGRCYMDAIWIVSTSMPGTPERQLTGPHGSARGADAWLTSLLDQAGIPESRLLWLDADIAVVQDVPEVVLPPMLALGSAAWQWCIKHSVDAKQYHGPRAWYALHRTQPYPFIQDLKELAS